MYCYSATGHSFARIDNFSPTVTHPSFWDLSSTSIAHFPQHSFENILRHEVHRRVGLGFCSLFFGHTVQTLTPCTAVTSMTAVAAMEKAMHTVTVESDTPQQQQQQHSSDRERNRTRNKKKSGLAGNTHIELTLTDPSNRLPSLHQQQQQQITCDVVVGADGAHSKVRQTAGVAMQGHTKIQTLLNVHFRCSGLKTLLTTSTSPFTSTSTSSSSSPPARSAMLYFIFNEVIKGYSENESESDSC